MVAARTRLQAARLERNWKQSHVLAELRRLAQCYRIPIAEGASLKTMLSRWENGHSGVGSDYRRLFCGIYGKDDAELGFTDQQGVFLSDPAEELRQRLATAASVNPSLVRLLAAQTDQLRVMDRQFGALPLLDQMRAHVTHAEELLAHAVLSTQRQPLASVLSDAAALAGWQAIDRAALEQAWRCHETAKAAAREAESPVLLAHAAAQQAYILAELGWPSQAVALARETRVAAQGTVPALVTAWLWAVEGELAADTGNRRDCLSAFEAAEHALPGDPVDPELPYVVLDAVHLARWRGSALARLGDADAIDYLYAALHAMESGFARARAALHTDLAYAHAAVGDHDQARVHLRQAGDLAWRIGSTRQCRRVEQLALPG
ncbi:MAG TPA: amino acid ABC transporter substrate-binding protein [Mycobacteriales bacterium]